MCGFVCYVCDSALPIERMTDAMAHRGPDDSGTRSWVFGDGIHVGLGHRRLSVIDTSTAGRQPMSDEDGVFWLTYNGEFYGFQSEREALVARGHRFRSRTDSEVIVHLYAEFGDDLLPRLDGMFAFGIWDDRRKRLLVARDRMGIKPVYYYHKDGRLIVASEIPAILAAGDVVDRTIDVQAVHNYLSLTYIPAPRTIFRHIRKLPAGHRLVWQDGVVSEEPYWEIEFRREPGPEPSFDEAKERVAQLFEDSVRRRLIADVPLGVFLSAGIDSTVVAAMVAYVGSERPKTFTIGFDVRSFNEADDARETARILNTDHHEMVLTLHALDLVFDVVDYTGEPFADSSALATWHVAKMARENVTVALGGDGGDELFAGYQPHRAHKLARVYRALPAPLRDRLIPWAVNRLSVSNAKVSFDFKAKQFVHAAALPSEEAHYGFKEFLPERERMELFASSGNSLMPTYVDVFEPHVERAMSFFDPLDRILYLDQKIYLADNNLTKVDRMSMAHALEVRVPILDHRLVEYVATLPSHYKMRGLSGKRILKQVLSRFVPKTVLKRKKAGFDVPMATWLNGELSDLVSEYLSQDRMRGMGLFDPKRIDALVASQRNNERHVHRTVWALLLLSIWWERTGGDLPCSG